jgi:hypothetical protein
MPAAGAHHRSRRRGGLATFAFSAHPRITLVAVVIGAIGLAMALRTVGAIGSSTHPVTATRAEGPVASAAAHAPAGLPGRVSPTASASARTSAKSTPSTAVSTTKEPVVAVPPTSSPVPVPSQALMSYEAEAPEAIRAPGMPIRDLEITSGGRYVGNVGDGRALRFTNVAAEGSGEYTLTIYYLSAEIRTAELRINGGPPQLLTFAPSGGWRELASIAVKVQLLVGFNTVEFGNPEGQPSPNLDRITLQG